MGRKIDFSKPLTADEAAFVADRPWLRTDAELQGFDVTLEDDDFIVDDNEGSDQSEGADDTGSEGEDESAGDDADTDTGETGESEDEAEGDAESEVLPYDQWEYADLKAEAKDRGLTATGSKEQLIERLTEDDKTAEAAE